MTFSDDCTLPLSATCLYLVPWVNGDINNSVQKWERRGRVYSQNQAKEMLKKMDEDGNAEITREEFMTTGGTDADFDR